MLFFYYSVDTTGPDPGIHALIRLSGILVKNGVQVETISLEFAPFPGDLPHAETIAACRLTVEEIKRFPRAAEGLHTLAGKIGEHCGTGKCILVGWGCASKDDRFLRMAFGKAGIANWFTGSFFWPSVDLATSYTVVLADKRPLLPNFGLDTVCHEMGISVDAEGMVYPIYRASLIRKLMRAIRIEKR